MMMSMNPNFLPRTECLQISSREYQKWRYQQPKSHLHPYHSRNYWESLLKQALICGLAILLVLTIIFLMGRSYYRRYYFNTSGFIQVDNIHPNVYNSWLTECFYIYGPEKPLLDAYFHFLEEVLINGNFGLSMRRYVEYQLGK